MSRRIDPPGIAALLRTLSDDVRSLKRGPGRWIYVGTYPGDPGTTPESPPFENGWENNVADDFPPMSFYIDKWRRVKVRGAPISGVIGTTIFTLPEEYRPAFSERFACAGDGALAIIQVDPTGEVTQIL